MITKTLYNLQNVNIMADLNQGSTNFIVNFEASSSGKIPFKVAALNQQTLDSGDMPDFHTSDSNGQITGTVEENSNEFQNYFLVMNAESPCDVELKIEKTELPYNHALETQQTQQIQHESTQNDSHTHGEPIKKRTNSNASYYTVSIILIVALVGSLWLFFNQEDSSGESTTRLKLKNSRSPLNTGFLNQIKRL